MVEKDGPYVNYDFHYDKNGKISSITTTYEKYWSNISFTYLGDQVTIIEETPKFNEKDTSLCIFNNENYITSISYLDKMKVSFSYEDGYLIKTKAVISTSKYGFVSEENYKYKDGLLVNVDISSVPDNKFSYTDIPNLGNLFMFPEDISFAGLFEYHLCGLFGKNTKYLPERTEWKGYDNDNTYIKDYEYELDEDGYVNTAKITHFNPYGKTISTINYTYEEIK